MEFTIAIIIQKLYNDTVFALRQSFVYPYATTKRLLLEQIRGVEQRSERQTDRGRARDKDRCRL